MAPGDLDRALCGIEFPTDSNVIVGLRRADDAGVYKINDSLAIVQTIDFFTPIVDDPYWFGQIAAANALSDVYAMGGVPKTALNMVCFPVKKMDLGILREVIQGGADKLKEADVVLIGGHSIEDQELKYGLSITGFIHPDRILTKTDLQSGDRLILTKPLGTGIINTAIKAGLAPADLIERITRQMAALNKIPAEVMAAFPVHACTDVTGFGLLGHLAEMVAGSGLGVRLWAKSIPVIPETPAFAAMGLIPAGAYKNKEFRQNMVGFAPNIAELTKDILFDPQTSGGLLICVASREAESLLHKLRKCGIDQAAIIGMVMDDQTSSISIE